MITEYPSIDIVFLASLALVLGVFVVGGVITLLLKLFEDKE